MAERVPPALDLRADEVEDLLERLKPVLLGTLRSYRIPRQEAGDILQDAMVAFVRKRRQIDNPEAWFTITLRRQCLLFLRAKRRRVWDLMDEALLDQRADPSACDPRDRVERRDLERALAGVSPKCRGLLQLRYVEGCTDPEIAGRTPYQVSGISQLVKRCLASLLTEMTRVQHPRKDPPR